MRTLYDELKHRRRQRTLRMYNALCNAVDFFVFDYSDAIVLDNAIIQERLLRQLVTDINEISLVKQYCTMSERRKNILYNIVKKAKGTGYSLTAKTPEILKTLGFNFKYG